MELEMMNSNATYDEDDDDINNIVAIFIVNYYPYQ